MDSAITDMIETAVLHRSEKIAAGHEGVVSTVEQRGKHIVDNVARQIIVMQQTHGKAVHLRIMCFEKPLYVVSVRHTPYIHTPIRKLNTLQQFFSKKLLPTVKILFLPLQHHFAQKRQYIPSCINSPILINQISAYFLSQITISQRFFANFVLHIKHFHDYRFSFQPRIADHI